MLTADKNVVVESDDAYIRISENLLQCPPQKHRIGLVLLGLTTTSGFENQSQVLLDRDSHKITFIFQSNSTHQPSAQDKMRIPHFSILLTTAAALLTFSRPTPAFLLPATIKSKRQAVILKNDALSSAKEQYDEAVREYNRLERLVQQGAAADKADGHSLESIFSSEDAGDIATLMIEKATAAAAAKALYEEELAHEQAHLARDAADEAAMCESMAQRAEQDLKALENRVKDIEGFADEEDDLERKRDMSAIHAVQHTLHDAKQHAKESKLAKDQARLEEAHALKESLQLRLNEEELKEDARALHDIIVEKTNKDPKKKSP